MAKKLPQERGSKKITKRLENAARDAEMSVKEFWFKCGADEGIPNHRVINDWGKHELGLKTTGITDPPPYVRCGVNSVRKGKRKAELAERIQGAAHARMRGAARQPRNHVVTAGASSPAAAHVR